MWSNSEWAYYYCKDQDDDPEVRKYITDSKWAYYYCANVKDRPEVRKHITQPLWKSLYYQMIEYRPVMEGLTKEYKKGDCYVAIGR